MISMLRSDFVNHGVSRVIWWIMINVPMCLIDLYSHPRKLVHLWEYTWYAWLTLVMGYWITGSSGANNNENTIRSYYWPFFSGIHRRSAHSPSAMLVLQIRFYVLMSWHLYYDHIRRRRNIGPLLIKNIPLQTQHPRQLLVFSCDQAALWMIFSVCPSVCLSVRHTFLTMFPSSYHHEISRSCHQGPE